MSEIKYDEADEIESAYQREFWISMVVTHIFLFSLFFLRKYMPMKIRPMQFIFIFNLFMNFGLFVLPYSSDWASKWILSYGMQTIHVFQLLHFHLYNQLFKKMKFIADKGSEGILTLQKQPKVMLKYRYLTRIWVQFICWLLWFILPSYNWQDKYDENRKSEIIMYSLGILNSVLMGYMLRKVKFKYTSLKLEFNTAFIADIVLIIINFHSDTNDSDTKAFYSVIMWLYFVLHVFIPFIESVRYKRKYINHSLYKEKYKKEVELNVFQIWWRNRFENGYSLVSTDSGGINTSEASFDILMGTPETISIFQQFLTNNYKFNGSIALYYWIKTAEAIQQHHTTVHETDEAVRILHKLRQEYFDPVLIKISWFEEFDITRSEIKSKLGGTCSIDDIKMMHSNLFDKIRDVYHIPFLLSKENKKIEFILNKSLMERV